MGTENVMTVLGASSSLKILSLRRGSVFKMPLTQKEGVRPKNPGDVDRTKYFVVLGIDDERILVGAVLINSEINKKLFPVIGAYQHRIASSEYSFLGKLESYVDCYSLKEIGYDSLAEARYVGMLNEADLAGIISLAISSPASKKLTLRKYHLL